jgi:hypothetical protein
MRNLLCTIAVWLTPAGCGGPDVHDDVGATARMVDPSRPTFSMLRDLTVPFGLRRADGRWRVLVSSR